MGVRAPVHLLAVDGNSMAHRAWHAIRDGDDAVGSFVLGGMVMLMASVWHHGPFDRVVVAFDDEVNERKQVHPTYKADRHTDEDLRTRLRALPDHFAAAGIATATVPGAEADDLLAAIAVEATRRGWHTDVLSGDRDLLPLVDDHVRVLRPRATMSDLVAYEAGTVRAEYGVDPTSYRHLAALRGDPSDGLPGVEGIGAKTAARLLADHHTLDELYANLCYLPAKHERALRAGRDLALANLAIMTPLPVEVDLDTATALDPARAGAVLEELEQGRVARRLRHLLELAARPVPPTPVDDTTTTATPGPAPRPTDVPWPDDEPVPAGPTRGSRADTGAPDTTVPWADVPWPDEDGGPDLDDGPDDRDDGDGTTATGDDTTDGASDGATDGATDDGTRTPGRLTPELGEQPSLF